MKIFMYWSGEGKEKLVERMSELNKKYDVVIGPTVEENEMLMKESKYYRESFKMKQGAFCSDVGRVYKLSHQCGLYVDVSTIIGKNIDRFIERNRGYDSAFFKHSNTNIACGTLGSGIENNALYKKVYDFYLRDDIDPRWTHILPIVLAIIIYNEYHFPINFEEFEFKDKIKIFKIDSILNEDEIMKVGVGSGGAKSKINNIEQYFDAMKNRSGNEAKIKFQNKEPYQYAVEQFNIVKKYGPETPFINHIREFYDIEPDKSKLIELKNAYKRIPYKIPLSKRLIGSKLYRLFTFKKAK